MTLATAVVLVGTLGLGLWSWLQGPAAFQSFWLPAVSQGTGLHIRASGGRVALDGRLRAVHLSVTGPGWRLSADDAILEVDVLSLLGDRPVIRDLRVREPVLIYSSAQGTSVEQRPWQLPVSMHTGTINDLRVELYSGERLRAVLDPVDVGVDDLRPGGRGVVTLAAPELTLVAGDGHTSWQGRLLGSANIDETGASGWTFDTSTGVSLWKAATPDDAVLFDVTGSGALSPQRIEGTGAVAATRGGSSAGRATGSWGWTPGTQQVTADLELDALGPSFINPVVATWAPVQLDRGQVQGQVRVEPSGDALGFTSHLTAQGVVLRTLGARKATPPMQLAGDVVGRVGAAVVELDRVDVGLVQAGREVVRARLDKPLVVSLDGQGSAEQTGHIGATLSELSADELRPWAALLGLTALDKVDRGVFSGELAAVVRDGGKAVDISGDLDIDELWLWSEASAVGPFVLDAGVAGDLRDLNRLTLQPSQAVLMAEGAPVATLGLSGWAAASGAADVAVEVRSDDVIAVGRALRLVPKRVRGGSSDHVAGTVRVRAQDSTEPWSIGGQLAVGEGTVGIDGTWPRKQGVGTVALNLQEVDVTPWLRAWEWVAWKDLGRAPLFGTLTYEGDGNVGTLTGEHRLGPVELPASIDARETVTLLGTSSTRLEGSLVNSTVTAHAQRAGREQDRIHAVWSMDRSLRDPLIHIEGSATELAADLYQNTLLGLDESAQPKTLSERLTTQVPVDFDLRADLLDVTWWGIALELGKLDVSSRAGNLYARLDEGRFSGGNIDGYVDYRPSNHDPGVEFALDGEQVDVGKLLAFSDPNWKPPLTARGDLHVSGKGKGQGDALVRDLEGRVVLTTGSGELHATGLLGAVARITSVGQFQGMRFDTLTARLDIDDGGAHIREMSAVGRRTKLDATGVIGLQGQLDVVVQPYVSGGIASGLASLLGSEHLVGPDGFTSLPASVGMAGTFEQPEYYARRPLAAGEERRGLWGIFGRR